MKQGVVSLAAVVVLVGLIGLAGCGKGPAGPAGEADAPTIMQARCSTRCHGLERVESHHFDRAGWKGVIDEMVGKGAKPSAAERQALIDFLTKRDADLPKTEHH